MSIKGIRSVTREQLFGQPKFVPMFDDFKCFKGKRIGITGASGFLGSILFERFRENNIHAVPFPGDIMDGPSLGKWLRKNRFHYFFHFAAIVPVESVRRNAIRAFETNVIGMFNVCKSIIESQKHCWLFLASSSHVYKPNNVKARRGLKIGSQGYPESLYGWSKLAGEQITRPLLEYYGVRYCIGRIFSFSGVNQKGSYLVPGLIRKIRKLRGNGILKVEGAASIRDIMDAETVVDCILYLAHYRYYGTLNIGSGKGTSVNQIARHIVRMGGKKLHIKGFNKTIPNSLVADVQDLKSLLLKGRM